MKINGKTTIKVDIDPLQVLENIHIIPEKNWIAKKGKKYIEMTEAHTSHSFDIEVGEIDEEAYRMCEAKILLLNYLRKIKYK